MVRKGLLVQLDAKPGQDAAVEDFLHAALPLARGEAGLKDWFGLRFGRSEYGMLDVFADEAARRAHLDGPLSRALKDQAGTLLDLRPCVQRFDVLVSKLPARESTRPGAKGLLTTFEAQEGREAEIEEYLHEARSLVEDEPDTTAWFALKLDGGIYSIFAAFPGIAGRLKHLLGPVPRGLTARTPWLLSALPDMEMFGVVAEKSAASPARVRA